MLISFFHETRLFMRIVFVHGMNASLSSGFLPWLGDALRTRGHEVITPELPNVSEPNCQEWVDAINTSIREPGSDTVFIGHSIGCVALLHYFEQADMTGTPKSTILIAPPYFIGSEKFASFFVPPVDWDTVEWKSQGFVVIHAKDDAKIPFNHAQKYEQLLRAQLMETETGGHFTDVKELPLILDLIDDRDVEPGSGLPNDFEEIDIVV